MGIPVVIVRSFYIVSRGVEHMTALGTVRSGSPMC